MLLRQWRQAAACLDAEWQRIGRTNVIPVTREATNERRMTGTVFSALENIFFVPVVPQRLCFAVLVSRQCRNSNNVTAWRLALGPMT